MPETNIAKPEIYNRQRQQFHPPHIDVIHSNGYSFLFTEYKQESDDDDDDDGKQAGRYKMNETTKISLKFHNSWV